jgi:hypothetical protein
MSFTLSTFLFPSYRALAQIDSGNCYATLIEQGSAGLDVKFEHVLRLLSSRQRLPAARQPLR